MDERIMCCTFLNIRRYVTCFASSYIFECHGIFNYDYRLKFTYLHSLESIVNSDTIF